MQASNRILKDWYSSIRLGEIKLPRFQRFEAWDRHRIASLMQTVIHNLPLGITLVLNVGDEEKFISRYLETAPQTNGRVLEHLLDGQQRLTAMWRMLHNNYPSQTYFVYFAEFDEYPHDEERDDLTVYVRNRYENKKGDRRPLWCDVPKHTLIRGFVPTELLRPEDIQNDIDQWLLDAIPAPGDDADAKMVQAYYEKRQRVSDRIRDIRATVANYNLPYLALPSKTEKSIALDVFINMNTNSKPLSQFDIIVAEVESVMEKSLHDLETALNEKCPAIQRYSDLSQLILTTSALLQGHLPNQRGAWEMDKRKLVENWERLEKCLGQMAKFLESEGILDGERLPTNAVLAPIAALYDSIPDSGDKRGQDELLLKKYIWHSFFSDRYENAAATHAFADFTALKCVVDGVTKSDGTQFNISDVPIFANHKLVDKEELVSAEWAKKRTILGRAVLAVICRLGALDFSTGQRLDAGNVNDRHYHHIYPDALLKEAGIYSFLALNCALITDKTNMSIGRKDPLIYLKDRYRWTSEAIVQERLQSHLIPIPELANGGYEEMSDESKAEKLNVDFNAFVSRRADLVSAALNRICDGHQLSIADVYEAADKTEVDEINGD